MHIQIETREDKDALIDTLTHQCVNLRSENQRLKGEASVMRALLREAYDVIDTIDGENAAECEALMDLLNQIKAAYQGSV